MRPYGWLSLRGGGALHCPKHGWCLDLKTLTYANGAIKTPLDPATYSLKGKILTLTKARHLLNPYRPSKKGSFTFRYLNHACLYFESAGLKIITDPWLLGSAFLTGWWHATPSSQEALECLQRSDVIYISHNHPDHLSPETLSLVSKDKLFICANFASKSTEKALKSLGFTRVITLDFAQIYALHDHAFCAVFKSGDFRDDSGLYLCLEGHEILLTVDSNFLNRHVLPRELTLLCSAFSSGASGFPLCFDNYSLEEKRAICARNKAHMKSQVKQTLEICKPQFYMPYAGMFTEGALRDLEIKRENPKNTPKDYQKLCMNLGVGYLAPRQDRILHLSARGLQVNSTPHTPLTPSDPEVYIAHYKKTYIYDAQKLIAYLQNSNYVDKQIVTFIPTNDNFSAVVAPRVEANFACQTFRVLDPQEEVVRFQENFRVMVLKIRAEILACVVENHLPFEDFSIGFHCRIWRNPNTYESAFWFHFTNVYANTHPI
ncbi:MBL fold metallo-hydrolase [Helicobacter baculiformis]|uniref:MBL fold metallo-hydrolase n=1 Tax=Helicobacter baculiformis TaxID=427351 RepID=UPI001F28BAD2|nr:MBL fold metallo-hydrolase [Helicobacter baculiformis]